MVGRTGGGTDIQLMSYDSAGAWQFGSLNVPDTRVTSSADLNLIIGSTSYVRCTASTVIVGVATLQFSVASPVFGGGSTATASQTPTTTRFRGINTTGSGTNVAGQADYSGADSIGIGTSNTGGKGRLTGGGASGATTNIGGDADVQAGSGSTTNGKVTIRKASGTILFQADDTGIAFFGGSTVAKPSDIGALTDSTTGTPGSTLNDVGAVPTQAAINNNFASVLTKINALRTQQRSLSLMA